MNHLHVLIPDLFPPQGIAAEVCVGLSLPVLEKLLARAEHSESAASGLEETLCASYGAAGLAPVRAAADGLDVGSGYWLCADPVSQMLVRAEVIVTPELTLDARQAADLCRSMQQHFQADGWHFHAPHPQRWYVQVPTPPRAVFQPLGEVVGQDAKHFQPQGEEALRWQGLLNEVQMLLYAHPLNRDREQNRQPLVSSLWLWGAGQAQPLSRPCDIAGGDDGLAAAFAGVAGVPWAENLAAMLATEGHGMWVHSALQQALRNSDLYGWREALQRCEREILHPVWQALRAGRLHKVVLEVPQGRSSRRFEISRAGSWRLWRETRPLADYAV